MEKVAKQGHVWKNRFTGDILGSIICVPEDLENSFVEISEKEATSEQLSDSSEQTDD